MGGCHCPNSRSCIFCSYCIYSKGNDWFKQQVIHGGGGQFVIALCSKTTSGKGYLFPSVAPPVKPWSLALCPTTKPVSSKHSPRCGCGGQDFSPEPLLAAVISAGDQVGAVSGAPRPPLNLACSHAQRQAHKAVQPARQGSAIM